MTELVNLLNLIFDTLRSFILVDFTNYSGSLHPTFLAIYNQMSIVISYLIVVLFVYLIFNLLFRLFKGVR